MRRGKSYSGIITIAIFLILIGVAFYIYSSKNFERNAPKIVAPNQIYWNMKKPIDIVLKDDTGIKNAIATLQNGKNSIIVANNIYANPQKIVHLAINPPKNSFMFKRSNFILNIETVDKSKWNFFSGNKSSKSIAIIVDRKRPDLFVENSSYGIRKGGSAIVVFKANDKNLDKLYIKTPFGKKFYPTPFYKKGYYISLLAWPVEEQKFRADIVAIDKANNISKAHVPLYLKPAKYKKSIIKLSDKFLKGKIADFIEKVAPDLSNASLIKQFKYVNETERKKDENLIHKITSPTDKNMITNFNIKSFHPLIGARKIANFGDYRTYIYNGKKLSNSYHLGLDLAKVKRSKIRAAEKGRVVFAKFNGIYGNNMIIYHGLGLYTLYGHCSEFLVQKDDTVKRAQIIARTGKTGLAMGDHLHFGVLIQGIEVNPIEWFDDHWIKVNILNVIRDSKKLIDKK